MFVMFYCGVTKVMHWTDEMYMATTYVTPPHTFVDSVLFDDGGMERQSAVTPFSQ